MTMTGRIVPDLQVKVQAGKRLERKPFFSFSVTILHSRETINSNFIQHLSQYINHQNQSRVGTQTKHVKVIMVSETKT